MKPLRYLAILSSALLPVACVVLATSTAACNKKEETEAPPPPPAPAPTPTPATTLIPEEDAGVDADAGDAGDADAAPKPTGPDPVRKCCNAIAQNMKSAPPDQQLAYGAALAACNGVATGQGRQALNQVRTMLRGAGIPADCQ